MHSAPAKSTECAGPREKRKRRKAGMQVSFLREPLPRTGVRMRCESELPPCHSLPPPPTGENLTLLSVDFVSVNPSQLFHLEFHQRSCDLYWPWRKTGLAWTCTERCCILHNCYYSLVSKSCPTLATWWTMLCVACQAPLSTGFPWTEWVTIFFSRDLPDPGIKAASPALAGEFFTTEPPGKPPLMEFIWGFSGVVLTLREFSRGWLENQTCVEWVFPVVDENLKFWSVTQGDLHG